MNLKIISFREYKINLEQQLIELLQWPGTIESVDELEEPTRLIEINQRFIDVIGRLQQGLNIFGNDPGVLNGFCEAIFNYSALFQTYCIDFSRRKAPELFHEMIRVGEMLDINTALAELFIEMNDDQEFQYLFVQQVHQWYVRLIQVLQELPPKERGIYKNMLSLAKVKYCFSSRWLIKCQHETDVIESLKEVENDQLKLLLYQLSLFEGAYFDGSEGLVEAISKEINIHKDGNFGLRTLVFMHLIEKDMENTELIAGLEGIVKKALLGKKKKKKKKAAITDYIEDDRYYCLMCLDFLTGLYAAKGNWKKAGYYVDQLLKYKTKLTKSVGGAVYYVQKIRTLGDVYHDVLKVFIAQHDETTQEGALRSIIDRLHSRIKQSDYDIEALDNNIHRLKQFQNLCHTLNGPDLEYKAMLHQIFDQRVGMSRNHLRIVKGVLPGNTGLSRIIVKQLAVLCCETTKQFDYNVIPTFAEDLIDFYKDHPEAEAHYEMLLNVYAALTIFVENTGISDNRILRIINSIEAATQDSGRNSKIKRVAQVVKGASVKGLELFWQQIVNEDARNMIRTLRQRYAAMPLNRFKHLFVRDDFMIRPKTDDYIKKEITSIYFHQLKTYEVKVPENQQSIVAMLRGKIRYRQLNHIIQQLISENVSASEFAERAKKEIERRFQQNMDQLCQIMPHRQALQPSDVRNIYVELLDRNIPDEEIVHKAIELLGYRQ